MVIVFAWVVAVVLTPVIPDYRSNSGRDAHRSDRRSLGPARRLPLAGGEPVRLHRRRVVVGRNSRGLLASEQGCLRELWSERCHHCRVGHTGRGGEVGQMGRVRVVLVGSRTAADNRIGIMIHLTRRFNTC